MANRESASIKILENLVDMKIIDENPYRLLGVFSNSPTRERVANQAKLKAFLKVGRAVSYPLDLPGLLPSVNRTEAMIADAESKLTLPADQLKYAQFWFLKDGQFDEVAFNHLFVGEKEKAIDIWGKKDTASSLQNRIVCALIDNDLAMVCTCAEALYSRFADTFVAMVLGDTVKAGNPAFDFIDNLSEEIGVNELLAYVNNSEWRDHLNEKAIAPIINELHSAIERAKNSRANGSVACYNAGVVLMNETKNSLRQLKKLSKGNDLQYQIIADKLANEILQCGIDYFNDTKDSDAPQKALSLSNYALSISVGQIAIDRCHENINILERLGDDYVVRTEMSSIGTSLNIFRDGPHNSRYARRIPDSQMNIWALGGGKYMMSDVSQFLDETSSDLQSIKLKLGASNNMYLKISSAVASTAINAIVEIINSMQKNPSIAYFKDVLQSQITKAVSLMTRIGALDMTSDCRAYFNTNNATLRSIDSKINPSDGCYIATMAYGDYDHPQVMVLRKFRDEYLDKRDWGKRFIKYYYAHSPIWVEHLKNHKTVNLLIRKCLDSFIYFLKK